MQQRRDSIPFLISAGVGAASTVLLTVGIIGLVERLAPEHLPPPAISNRIDLDEKLSFLRRHPGWRPSVLAVGSSITLRSLYGAPFSKQAPPQHRFLNAGVAGAQIHQVHQVGRFFMELYPEVRTVVQVVVPPDFRDCTTLSSGVLFNPAEARAYIRGEMSSTKAYLKHFNPEELIPEALRIAANRRNWTDSSSERLYTDEFGSMPMDMLPAAARQRHTELYRSLNSLDPNCFRELQDWSREVRQRGARLVIVVPPFSPLFMRTVAGAPQYIDEFVALLNTTLQSAPVAIIDQRSLAFDDGAFADAYHLLWPAARVFSAHVSDALEP